MSQNKSYRKRSYQIEEYNSPKNSTHLHCFDLRVWRFSPVRSGIWLYNICKVSVPHKLSSLPKAPYKLIRSRLIKREGKLSKYALVRNHLQIWVTWENHSMNKIYLIVFKNHKNPSFSAGIEWEDLNPSCSIFQLPKIFW